MGMETAEKIILTILTLAAFALLLVGFYKSTGSCKSDFEGRLTQLEVKVLTDFGRHDEPVEDWLELPVCVEYVTYESGSKCSDKVGEEFCKCIKFVGEDEEECLTTNQTIGEESYPVKYVGFDPYIVSRGNTEKYRLILDYARIKLKAVDCCPDCSCSKDACVLCKEGKFNEKCYFNSLSNKCLSIDEGYECNVPLHCVDYCIGSCGGKFSKCDCVINDCVAECRCDVIDSCEDYTDELECGQDGCGVGEECRFGCGWNPTETKCFCNI